MKPSDEFWLGLLLGLVLGWVTPAHAGEWLSLTLGSHHFDRDRDYNEFNYGIGYERTLSPEWRFAGGVYKNSYYRTSWYAVWVREMWTYGSWKAGTAFGGVSGYTHGRVDPVAAPIIAWEGKDFGVNLFPVSPKVIGLQVKFKF